MSAAFIEESPDGTQWKKAVALIQTAFLEGHLTEECIWKTFVLIPKGRVYFHVIGIVKLLWNTAAGIMTSGSPQAFTSTTTFMASALVRN